MVDLLVLFWLALCAWHDLRKREVPDWLTLPALGPAFLWRILQPGGDWLPFALAGVTLALCLLGFLPGGDAKGLMAMGLYDPGLFVWVWVGAVVTYLPWRLVFRQRRLPGYVGFLVGAVGWFLFRIN